MNNVIECICRLLPNKVLITVPTLQNNITYVVVGIYNLDTDIPTVMVKNLWYLIYKPNEPEFSAHQVEGDATTKQD